MTKDEAVLKEIEELSRESFSPIIGPIKGKYLTAAVERPGVKKVLEIGTLIGYSAILIARNLSDDGRLTTIEINPDSAKRARDNIEKAGLSGKVTVITGNAISLIPELGDVFDMVFIDANKSDYMSYLKLAEDKLRRGGIVFADNVKMFAGQMKDYLDYVRNSGK